jgi:hypothetical protein
VPTDASFEYVTIRIVPRVEREEFVNIGVIVFCLEKRYLAARMHVDDARLAALWPELDTRLVHQHADAIQRIAEGDPAAGPVALLSQRERFRWLSAPRSTIIQPSATHTGICAVPDGLLDRLFATLVSAPPAAGGDPPPA